MDMDNQVSYVVNLPTLIDKVFQQFYFLFFLFILNLQLYSDIVKLQGGTYSVLSKIIIMFNKAKYCSIMLKVAFIYNELSF